MWFLVWPENKMNAYWVESSVCRQQSLETTLEPPTGLGIYTLETGNGLMKHLRTNFCDVWFLFPWNREGFWSCLISFRIHNKVFWKKILNLCDRQKKCETSGIKSLETLPLLFQRGQRLLSSWSLCSLSTITENTTLLSVCSFKSAFQQPVEQGGEGLEMQLPGNSSHRGNLEKGSLSQLRPLLVFTPWMHKMLWHLKNLLPFQEIKQLQIFFLSHHPMEKILEE